MYDAYINEYLTLDIRRREIEKAKARQELLTEINVTYALPRTVPSIVSSIEELPESGTGHTWKDALRSSIVKRNVEHSDEWESL